MGGMSLARIDSGGMLEHGKGIAFQGGGMKSYTSFYAALWGMKDQCDLETVFEDFHIGTNSGGGWFMGGLVSSQRFWNDFASNDVEKMLDSFMDMLSKQGDKLESKKLSKILQKAGVPEDSSLYAFAGAGSFLEEPEPWRSVCHALFDDEFKGTDKKFKYDTWTSLAILLKHANTTNVMKYNIRNNKDNKALAYPVMLHYNNDSPSCEIPGISDEISIKFNKAKVFHKTIRESKQEEEKQIVDCIGTNIVDFVGPSSAALGSIASTPYIEEKTLPGKEGLAEALPSILHSFAWPTKNPEKADGKFTYLADGGTEDNMAISAVIYRMQQEGFNTGTIISFQNLWETYKLFENPGPDAKKDEMMYQTIFQNTAPRESAVREGCEKVTITKFMATTVDNPQCGIAGDCDYEIIVIALNFVTPLLPNDEHHDEANEEYRTAMRTIVSDMSKMAKDGLLNELGLELFE